MKRLIFSILILLVCAFLIIGCSTSSSTKTSTTTTTSSTTTTAVKTTTTPPAETPKTGGTFKYIDPRSPATTLGWLAEPGPPLGLFASLLFDALTRSDIDGTIRPRLATAWNLASDLKSVTFTLRKGVKFHDGSDFNAQVAKWNFDQYLGAKLASVKDIDSVDVVDDYTIKLNLKQYENTLLGGAIGGLYMVSKAAFDKSGIEGLRWNPVGTGPFKFASFERDVVLKTSKFSDYWDKGKPYLDAVEAHFIQDTMTAQASFEAGEVDAVGGDVAKLLYDMKQKGAQITSVYSGAATLIPDSKNANSILANVKVRQAIDYAIDREAVVKARGFGYWIPTYQFAPPDASAYIKDLPARTYNPDKAKQLLAEAGYPNGFKTKIIGDSSTADKEATVAIQGFLSKVGIEAQLDWVDFAGFVQYVMGGWQDALLFCANGFYAGNLNDGIDFVWTQSAAFFPSVLKTDELQSLVTASLRSKDYNPALVQKTLRYMHDEAMFLPLYCISRGHALKPYIHDTGMDSTLQALMSWTPENTWLSK
jgi:peptide/nickel transport system substrate-binding protein